MYKAINIRDGSDVILLDSRWSDALDSLRSLDRQDTLICQGCKQPLRVRAGEVRRRHFAHKHLRNCNHGHDSPELLNARAVLYEWLVVKSGGKVEIEKEICNDHSLRPADCWIERETGSVAYWIVDAAMKPQFRETVQSDFRKTGVTVNYVFISQMLREDKSEAECIHLTTTEREFMNKSAYDDLAEKRYLVGKSLHYLDADNGSLITYRGLQCIHEPQLYKGCKQSHALSLVLLDAQTGEFIHPGEDERLKKFQREQIEQEKRRQQLPASTGNYSYASSYVTREQLTEKKSALERPDRESICEICGKKTPEDKWWTFSGITGLCKCKDCLQQGKY